MTTREEIENRLGIFARRALFDNCGIGPNGFEPGKDCGGKPGSGGSEGKAAPKSGRKAAKTDKTAKGIEERAKAAGKTFTEQWLEETDADINRNAETEDRRRRRADERRQTKADEKVKEIERKLSELKARGPEISPRQAEATRKIEKIDKRIADIRKEMETRSADAATAAEDRKKQIQVDRDKRTEKLRKKWTKMFGPKKAEEMLGNVAKAREQAERESAGGK